MFKKKKNSQKPELLSITTLDEFNQHLHILIHVYGMKALDAIDILDPLATREVKKEFAEHFRELLQTNEK